MRSALIVATADYDDPGLRRLRAPAQDAEALAAVLRDPAIGDFEVRTLLNQPAHVVNEAVEEFFDERAHDDLLLVHFSCHGIRDEDGVLYFAAANTKLRRLGATAVSAEFVNRKMDRSRSRRIVLLLDCCYAGAFGRGAVARAGTGVAIDEHLGGRGRAVITASSALEYAFEAGELAEGAAPQPSVFTSALVDGLASGEADRDLDGRIALDELYDYVYDRVRDVTPNQTPGKWTFGVEGELYVARRRGPVTTPAPLPPQLQEALDHPLPGVRAGAVNELARLLKSAHPGMSLGAQLALERLHEDDSRTVAAAAAAALSDRPPAPAPAALSEQAPAPAAPGTRPSAAAGTPPPAATGPGPPRAGDGTDGRDGGRGAPFAGQLAVAGAVLLVVGLFPYFQWDTAVINPEFTVWQIAAYIALAAGGAAAAGVACLLPGTRRLTGPGLLAGVAAGVTWGLVAMGAYWVQEDGQGFQAGFWLEILGQLLVLGAGVRAGTALRRDWAARPVPRGTSELQQTAVLLGFLGALGLLLHHQALAYADVGMPDEVSTLWATLLAVAVPAGAALLRPPPVRVAVLRGWVLGAGAVFGYSLVHTAALRGEGYTLSTLPVLGFGVTLAGLLVVSWLLGRAPAPAGPAGGLSAPPLARPGRRGRA